MVAAASVPVPAASNRPVLPMTGMAVVKSVLSGDTVILLGRAQQQGAKPPEVVFTFERVSSPRMASKVNDNRDEGGAFPAREYLRRLCVGKTVRFETRKQGATAGDRVYGLLFLPNPDSEDKTELMNLAVESVRRGHASPKIYHSKSDKDNGGDNNGDNKNGGDGKDHDDGNKTDEYESQLEAALQEAKSAQVGIHRINPPPLCRNLKNAVEDFQPSDLVHLCQQKKVRVTCVVEYIFDGSRMRCQLTGVGGEDAALAPYLYANFTLILAGVACPRVGNPRATPPTESEPFAVEARTFVDLRLLQRELPLDLHGTDKSGSCIVGTVHHPRGSIAVELLKNGLGRVSDWTARMMNPLDLPALRIAENSAKRTNTGLWQNYAPPKLQGASEISGTVVEVVTGDTISILPNGQEYDDESKLCKISLSSVRSPRIGNERMGKPDEPWAVECKDRLRVLTVGKVATVHVDYERDIPMGQSGQSVTRQFGTVSVPKRDDVGEVLINEGLAVTQRHRDDDEKSPRYDQLVAAEHAAKEAKKGVHSEADYGKKNTVDLTDPKKAKAYSGSLMRSGSLKAIVEYVFNGSRFKIYVPSENCAFMFACESVRCPQPSPNVSAGGAARGPARPSEPFGDASKRHARLTVLQRSVEITCRGITQGGVITGSLFVGQGAQKCDYTIELLGSGLATLDERKLEYGEVAQVLIDSQSAAQNNKVGVWSIEQVDSGKNKNVVKVATKSKEMVKDIRLSEIRDGRHFFFHTVGDEAIKVIDDSMKLFTSNNGTKGAPCDAKPGKVVAALFDDGTEKAWYRAKCFERKGPGKMAVLFVDHGNVATVNVATHLRPLDVELGIDRIPAVARESQLALIHVRSIDDDDGLEAARTLQRLGWGKDLKARIYGNVEGKSQVALYDPKAFEDEGKSINEEIVSEGLARNAKPAELAMLKNAMMDGAGADKLHTALATAQADARKRRAGMWRYGDIGDEDEED